MNLTLKTYLDKVKKNELSAGEVCKHYLQKAKEKNQTLNAFTTFHEDYIEKNWDELSKKARAGIPVGIKDIINTKGYETEACSKILKGYKSPYSATCFSKREEMGACMFGKTNTDEFAMGGSSEYSCHGPTKNPHDHKRVAGGSSGGSAASVAADMVVAALGTDTGGSIRLPASLCGVVGCRPTYGRVSRYGVMAMASSFDQIGTFTKTVEDTVIMLSALAGYDENDSTSVKRDDTEKRNQSTQRDIKGLKCALPKQFFSEGLDERIKERILQTVEKLEKEGAIVEYVDMPILNYTLAAYYVLVPAEVSTNMARYEGMRFGEQTDTTQYSSFHDYMSDMRSQYLGPEVKRRILIGSYVLSSAHYEGYFLKAQKLRMMVKQSFDKVFEKFDLIIGPTSPELAWKIGEKDKDPLSMYLADIYTVPVNLAGLPGMSVPVGTIKEADSQLPVGLQIIAQQRQEDKMFQLGVAIEKLLS